MPPLLQFIVRRLFYAVVSLVIITMVLYAGFMLTPAEARARLYSPSGKGGERVTQKYFDRIIKTKHLDDPYLVQYGFWIQSLVTGSWGYSPTLGEQVLPSLLRRTPATLELAAISIVLLIPLGIASGLTAGWQPRRSFDNAFRGLAFLGTSTPPFIVAIILLAIFYIQLDWFAPGRIDLLTGLEIAGDSYRRYTGMITIDSLLNGRLDIFANALRHLAMPVFTLVIYHWATLGRITRATVIGEREKEYIVAARARGISDFRLVWRHTLRVILAPALTATTLSAAAIVTGVFVVETIFAIKGVSQVIVVAMSSSPDASAALGFTIYSTLMVIGLMFLLDVIQAVIDPRVRDEVLKT